MKNPPELASILRLRDPLALNPNRTGGKAANLAHLLEAGLPVPDGVCVTTAVYERLTDDPELTALINDLDRMDPESTEDIQRTAARIRDRLRERPLADEVRTSIEDQLNPDERYVVRSSATAEDLPDASFAGQHETVLDVAGTEAILTAISTCMASLFTDRAVTYRARNEIPHGTVAMAVVIQRMVDADASGVLFTADPLSGRRDRAAIDAAPGLGEDLVSGSLTPDHVVVDRDSNDIIDYQLGEHEETERVLADAQIRTLVTFGNRIEVEFDGPQDIEWSFTDGQCWILQSRPITTLFPLPSPPPTDDGLHVYFSFNHRQGMTEPMPPLVADFFMRTIDYSLDAFGFNPPTGPAVGAAGGLLYIDATHIVRSTRLRGKFFEGLRAADPVAVPLLEDVLERRGDELSRISLIRGLSPTQTLSTVAKLLPVGIRSVGAVVYGLVTNAHERAAMENRHWCDRQAAHSINEIRAGAGERERLRLCLEENERFTWAAWKQAFQLWNVYIHRKMLEWLCPDAPDEFASLERGLRENVTTQMMLELGDLADLARNHPQVESALRDGRDLKEVRAVEGGKVFTDAFEAFMEAYGFRAPAEIEFSKPRYAEDPSPLLATIRSMLASGERNEHRNRLARLKREAEEAITALERSVEGGLGGPLRKRLVRSSAVRYRGYLAMREGPKYGYAQLIAETRRQVLAAGDRLARDGVLERPTGVWFFDFDELFEALEYPADAPEIDIDARRAEYERDCQWKASRVITSDGEVPRPPPDMLESSDVLTGTPTSSGVAEGIARVVRDPRDSVVEPGEILVARDTDPGWTPLFLNAVGLVTNVGGRMTHGSIVAREHGIPSVVVPEATERITTGDRVRVDGDRGIVEVLADGDEED